MSWVPGLVVRIDDKGMHVKVPTGDDCPACPIRTACSFEGPDKAYRTIHVGPRDGIGVGDRIEVEQSAAAMGVAFVAMLLVPIILLACGYLLDSRFGLFDEAPYLLWVPGMVMWLAVIFMANRWMERSRRFEARIRRGPKTSSG